MIFPIFQTSGVTWLCPISMFPVLAIMKWDLGGATILVTNRWNRRRFPWIFSKFLTFTLHTFVFIQMCPSPSPMFRATRILEHWNDCNTQINTEEGETHTSVTSNVVIISSGVVPGGTPWSMRMCRYVFETLHLFQTKRDEFATLFQTIAVVKIGNLFKAISKKMCTLWLTEEELTGRR